MVKCTKLKGGAIKLHKTITQYNTNPLSCTNSAIIVKFSSVLIYLKAVPCDNGNLKTFPMFTEIHALIILYIF